MLDRRHLRNLDWGLLVAVLLLMVISVAVVSSATRQTTSDPLYFAKRQILWAAIGIVVIVGLLFFDYSLFGRMSNLIYLANLALLAAVMVPGVGHKELGAQRWINLGFMKLQPSELAKIAIIITLANFMRMRERKFESLRDYIAPAAHVIVPMLLVVLQPDLGTTLVFVSITLAVLYIAGAPGWHVGGVIVGGIGLGSLAVYLHEAFGLPIFLKDYQIARLTAFVNPKADPLGTGYQLIQSIIAIGSGGFLGKGLFAGTQNALKFLPITYTDFIFSVIGEELGFVGVVLVLGLYFYVIYRGIRIALTARDMFGTLIATGVTALLTFHVLINIGMALGMAPVTGVPLPLMSYGGTSMLTTCMAIGLLEGVYMRRQKILF